VETKEEVSLRENKKNTLGLHFAFLSMEQHALKNVNNCLNTNHRHLKGTLFASLLLSMTAATKKEKEKKKLTLGRLR
jgi:hypothetical protein